MKGRVDENKRALLTVAVQSQLSGNATCIDAWIDTAFDGHFVFSSALIDQLDLETLVETEAILADGTKVTLQTFVAYLDWFGTTIPVQVVANEGEFPLLGTALFEERCLLINYREHLLELM